MNARSPLTRFPLRFVLTLILSLPAALILLALVAAPAYAGLDICGGLWGWDWNVCEESHHTAVFGLAGMLVGAGSAAVGVMAAAGVQGAAAAGQGAAAASQSQTTAEDPSDDGAWESEQTLSDGRTYREGNRYPFDDGQEYEFTGGQFTPVRRLSNGETYVSVDGDRRIWVGGQSWMESDWRQQQAISGAYQRAHEADWATESTTLNQHLVEHFARERAAMQEVARLQSMHDRIKAGHSTLSGSDSEYELLNRLQQVINQTRSTGEVDADSFNRMRRLVNVELARTEQANLAELQRAQTVARRWETATRAAELVKEGADKSIDILANVTGPAGQSVRRTYRVVSNVAGGASEGYVTGNWVQSMTEAGGRIVEGEIGDRLKTPKAKRMFTVASQGVKGGWEGGVEAYKRGDSILGAAALGALEGTVDGVSSVAKESLSGGKKMAYTVYEQSVKAGYGEFKQGGNVEDVRKAMEAKFMSAVLNEAIDFGTGAVLDHWLPASGAVDSEVMAQHQWQILKELNLEDHPELLDQILEDWQPEYIADEINKELRKVIKEDVKGTVTNALKGEGMMVENMQSSYTIAHTLSAWS